MAIISKNNEDMLKIVANQKEPLTKLLELMVPYKTDKDVAEMADALKPLADIYAMVGVEKLTTEQFEQINKAVSQVRGILVQ